MNYWLTGMTTWGNGDHLKELISPISHLFDGLCWVFHSEEIDGDPVEDEGYKYLLHKAVEMTDINNVESSIIISPWVKRNDYSRNKTLYEGNIKIGDYCLVIDTLERIQPEFVEFLMKTISDNPQIDCIYLEGKRLFFKVCEATEFQGNPHESIRGVNNRVNITFKQFPQLEQYWKNIRPEVRDEYHWVDAYFNYYFFPMTNHLLLGYEGDREYVEFRYNIRAQLFSLLMQKGFDISKEGFCECMKYGHKQELLPFFNQEKILNDWYRYNYLEDKSVVDKHDWKLIKEIKE